MEKRVLADNQGYEFVLEAVPNGIVLFDHRGNQIYTNDAYAHIPSSLKDKILAMAPNILGEEGWFKAGNYDLKFSPYEDGSVLVVTELKHDDRAVNNALETIVSAIKVEDNIYEATAKAVSKCLGWRWVSVTQFLTKGKVEVLAFWDTDHLIPNYVYDIAGTPCEKLIENKGITFFSDVDKVFSHNEAFLKMGAKTYAGLVYYGANGEPVGHIMALHNERNVDYQYAREVFDLASLMLSSHMLHNQTKEILAETEKQANTDSLTGILNRKAFDAYLECIEQSNRKSDQVTLLAIFDLDGLKALNDNNGHEKGDEFIKLFANEMNNLGRDDDLSFRTGGDEFAAVFPQSCPEFKKVLEGRIDKAINKITKTLGANVGVSVGFALLSETKGNVKEWTKLADARMYEAKKSK